MNISLRGRVAGSFIIATIFVAVLGAIVFSHLNSLKINIEQITNKSAELDIHGDQVRVFVGNILRYQQNILQRVDLDELAKKINNTTDEVINALKNLNNIYTDTEIKQTISNMIGKLDSLKIFLSKGALSYRNRGGIASAVELSGAILDTFDELRQKQEKFKKKLYGKNLTNIINQNEKTMMIILVCTLLFAILLGLIVPGKIALPFKKINDALRELQECNFDVSIFYDKGDEIGEIAHEMNKMIKSIKKFEELRTDRITVEHKKFEALASLTKRYVLVANAKGELIYMNNQLYSLMDISSDEVLHKEISDILIPKSIREIYEMAIKRRTKVENATVEITRKKEPEKEREKDRGQPVRGNGQGEHREGENNAKTVEPETQAVSEEAEVLFKGYANVVPIRGKESSLDYYLMVLSPELFS